MSITTVNWNLLHSGGKFFLMKTANRFKLKNVATKADIEIHCFIKKNL
jgi:hypothetical protein